MTGLRETKKQETRRRIIDESRRLFGEKGFARTTTTDIARAANIGEGTLFNYFSTKGELFIAAVFEGYRPKKYVPSVPAVVDKKTLTNEILSMLKHYFANFSSVDKKFLREYYATLYGNCVDNPLLWERVTNADTVAFESLRELFDCCKAANKLPHSFDTELAVNCIYGFVITQFIIYIYKEKYNFDDLFCDLEQAITFMLHGHFP